MRISVRTARLTCNATPGGEEAICIALGAGTHPIYLERADAVDLWQKLGDCLNEKAAEKSSV